MLYQRRRDLTNSELKRASNVVRQTNVVRLAWIFERKEYVQVVHSNISVVFDEQKPDMEDHRKRWIVKTRTSQRCGETA